MISASEDYTNTVTAFNVMLDPASSLDQPVLLWAEDAPPSHEPALDTSWNSKLVASKLGEGFPLCSSWGQMQQITSIMSLILCVCNWKLLNTVHSHGDMEQQNRIINEILCFDILALERICQVHPVHHEQRVGHARRNDSPVIQVVFGSHHRVPAALHLQQTSLDPRSLAFITIQIVYNKPWIRVGKDKCS
jgi:hypothetical protein